jgi:hypothetical protein
MDTTNNQFQVLSVLLGLDQTECRHNMSNYDSFMNSFQWKMSIRAFIAHLRNAENNYLNEDYVSEKRSLLQAMNIIEFCELTDKDLINEKLQDYITGTFMTSGKIVERLDELGEVVKQQ